MADDSSGAPRASLAGMLRSEPIAAALLLGAACACATALLLLPRPVVPLDMPQLTLPEAPVRRVIDADRAAARTAPSSEHAKALEALLLEHGRAEAAGPENLDKYTQRRAALAEGFRRLSAEIGEARALALRAKAVQQFEAALALELPEADAGAVLGAMPHILARERAARDGVVVAPHFVLRTLFKARWNLLHGLPPEHAFETIERRAFYGWQALHAERVSVTRRLAALDEYEKAGGARVEEARGILLLAAGDVQGAAQAFARAYQAAPSLRLRNYQLGVRAARESAARARN